MKLQFFTVPAQWPEQAQQILNAFCGQHWVMTIEKYFVELGDFHNRNRNDPDERNNNNGFRLALARAKVDTPFNQIVISTVFFYGKNKFCIGAQVDTRSKAHRCRPSF